MTKPKAKQPLESFDPRLMELLKAGARRRITIPFLGPEGRAKATTFRRRLHTLRARMRQQNHEHSTLVSRCLCRLFWGSEAVKQGLTTAEGWETDRLGSLGAYLIIEPADAQFESILSSLHLEGEAAGEIEAESPLSVEDLLKDLPTEN